MRKMEFVFVAYVFPDLQKYRIKPKFLLYTSEELNLKKMSSEIYKPKTLKKCV